MSRNCFRLKGGLLLYPSIDPLDCQQGAYVTDCGAGTLLIVTAWGRRLVLAVVLQ